MAKITYNDKVALKENADIPAINKITDNDMNEIKQVVNENDDKFLTNGLNVSNEVDEDYRVNVIYAPNLFTGTLEQGSLGGSGETISSNERVRTTDYISVESNTKYRVAVEPSGKEVIVFEYTENGTFIQQTSWTPTDMFITTSATTKKIKVVIRKPDNSTLTPSSITNLKVSLDITPSIYVDNEEIYIKENPTNYISSVNLLTNKVLSHNDNQVYVNNSKFVSLNITLDITGAISSGSDLIVLPEIARPKKANISLMAKLKSGGNYYVINCWCRTSGTLAFQHTSGLTNGDEVAIIGTYYALN
jgi:hypothetical protein